MKNLLTLLAISICLSSIAEVPQSLDWPFYGGTPGGGHYTTASQITAANVADLEVAWMHRSGDVRQGSVSVAGSLEGKRQMGSAFISTPSYWMIRCITAHPSTVCLLLILLRVSNAGCLIHKLI